MIFRGRSVVLASLSGQVCTLSGFLYLIAFASLGIKCLCDGIALVGTCFWFLISMSIVFLVVSLSFWRHCFCDGIIFVAKFDWVVPIPKCFQYFAIVLSCSCRFYSSIAFMVTSCWYALVMGLCYQLGFFFLQAYRHYLGFVLVTSLSLGRYRVGLYPFRFLTFLWGCTSWYSLPLWRHCPCDSNKRAWTCPRILLSITAVRLIHLFCLRRRKVDAFPWRFLLP